MKIGNDHKGNMNGNVCLTPQDIKMIAYCLSWCEGEDVVTCEDHLISFGALADQFRAMDVHFAKKELDSGA